MKNNWVLLFIFLISFNVHLFLKERETEHEGGGGREGGQRERETQNPKQDPGSELSAQSPTQGLNPQRRS